MCAIFFITIAVTTALHFKKAPEGIFRIALEKFKIKVMFRTGIQLSLANKNISHCLIWLARL